MNSRVSLPPISDILSDNGPKPVSLEETTRAYTAAVQPYQYQQAPVLIQQVPVQAQPPMQSMHSLQNMQTILNGLVMAAPMIAASPMSMSHPLASVYPAMVPMPGYRLINPNYHVADGSPVPNSSFTYRYPVSMPQQQPQLHSAQAVLGGPLRALVLELSTKASTPASPTSLDSMSRVNRMSPERVSEMVRRPSPPPVVRSRTRNNLPKETTYILLKWLEEHLNHPYPNSFEKTQLMFSTGLNQQQLSNWFINARRRKIRAMKQRQKV